MRRTIGTVTKSGQIAHAEIQLGDFKSWSSFRVLEWDAYDITLSYDTGKRFGTGKAQNFPFPMGQISDSPSK